MYRLYQPGKIKYFIVKEEGYAGEPKFKVVMIGAGDRANSVIYPSLADMDNVEIAAICDIDKERLNKTADKYGVERRYGESVYDYQRMIEDIKPDAVCNRSTPSVLRYMAVVFGAGTEPLYRKTPCPYHTSGQMPSTCCQ